MKRDRYAVWVGVAGKHPCEIDDWAMRHRAGNVSYFIKPDHAVRLDGVVVVDEIELGYVGSVAKSPLPVFTDRKLDVDPLVLFEVTFVARDPVQRLRSLFAPDQIVHVVF